MKNPQYDQRVGDFFISNLSLIWQLLMSGIIVGHETKRIVSFGVYPIADGWYKHNSNTNKSPGGRSKEVSSGLLRSSSSCTAQANTTNKCNCPSNNIDDLYFATFASCACRVSPYLRIILYELLSSALLISCIWPSVLKYNNLLP